MHAHPYVLADVFTETPLAGNQLAVFTHGEAIPERALQLLAREMNLSETVFVFPAERGGTARVRYFSTVQELDFAGHPTLGTAAILIREGTCQGGPAHIDLETNRGIVPVEIEATGESFHGWMTQPVPSVRPFARGDDLLTTLGVPASTLPIEVYDNGIEHVYVTLADAEAVLGIVPHFAALGEVGEGARINVFAPHAGGYTIRMFSPFDVGVPEDPACGSAAGPAALHLVRHGVIGSGHEIRLSQGEKVGRPSVLRAVAEIDGTTTRSVRVGGSVVIVGEGMIRLADVTA